METQQTVLWRLRQKGLDIKPHQLDYAFRSGALRRPRKNAAGHFVYTDADEKAIEVHFRGK